MGIYGLIGKYIVLPVVLGAAAYGAFTTLGGSEGVGDKFRKAEKVVGRYTGKPVGERAYNKYFRLSDGVVADQDPTRLTLVLCYEGNSFDYKPMQQKACSRRLVVNGTGPAKGVSGKREEIRTALSPETPRDKTQVWVELEAPTPEQRMGGLDPYVDEFNKEFQVFTPIELIKVRTYGQAKTDPSLFGTRPTNF